MKVRLVQQMSGTRGDGTPWPAWGEELEVSKEEALTLCSGQSPIAVPVPDDVLPSKKATEASGGEEATTKKEDGAGEDGTGAPAQTKPASSSTTRTASARQTGTAKK